MVHTGNIHKPRGATAYHNQGRDDADRLWPDNLVCLLVLEHAVLVNAAFVCKGIRTYDSLVGLSKYAKKISLISIRGTHF